MDINQYFSMISAWKSRRKNNEHIKSQHFSIKEAVITPRKSSRVLHRAEIKTEFRPETFAHMPDHYRELINHFRQRNKSNTDVVGRQSKNTSRCSMNNRENYKVKRGLLRLERVAGRYFSEIFFEKLRYAECKETISNFDEDSILFYNNGQLFEISNTDSMNLSFNNVSESISFGIPFDSRSKPNLITSQNSSLESSIINQFHIGSLQNAFSKVLIKPYSIGFHIIKNSNIHRIKKQIQGVEQLAVVLRKLRGKQTIVLFEKYARFRQIRRMGVVRLCNIISSSIRKDFHYFERRIHSKQLATIKFARIIDCLNKRILGHYKIALCNLKLHLQRNQIGIKIYKMNSCRVLSLILKHKIQSVLSDCFNLINKHTNKNSLRTTDKTNFDQFSNKKKISVFMLICVLWKNQERIIQLGFVSLKNYKLI